MITPKNIPAGLVVLTLAACGAAGAATMSGGAPAAVATLRCELVVAERRGMVDIEGRLTSPVATTGDYALRISQRGGGNSAVIAQDGTFAAAAGEMLTLGQASMSGSAANLNTTLTLRWQGQTLECPTVPGA